MGRHIGRAPAARAAARRRPACISCSRPRDPLLCVARGAPPPLRARRGCACIAHAFLSPSHTHTHAFFLLLLAAARRRACTACRLASAPPRCNSNSTGILSRANWRARLAVLCGARAQAPWPGPAAASQRGVRTSAGQGRGCQPAAAAGRRRGVLRLACVCACVRARIGGPRAGQQNLCVTWDGARRCCGRARALHARVHACRARAPAWGAAPVCVMPCLLGGGCKHGLQVVGDGRVMRGLFSSGRHGRQGRGGPAP